MLQEEVEAERKERHSSPRHSHGDSPYLGRSSNRSKGNWLAWAGCGLFVLVVVPLVPWETLLCLSPCPPTLFLFLFDVYTYLFLIWWHFWLLFLCLCVPWVFFQGSLVLPILGLPALSALTLQGILGIWKGSFPFGCLSMVSFAGFCERN